MTKYKAKQSIEAAQWKEDNLDEMRELLRGVVGSDSDGVPFVYADEIEPYFLTSLGHRPGYLVLKTEFDEFDPGVWVVVYEDGSFEGMDDEQFNKMFEKV